MKNTTLFWQQLFRYIQLHGGRPLPRHYQEAACLFALMQNRDVGQLPVEQHVVDSCRRFLETLDSSSEPFRTTYFYYYYFNHDNFYEQ